MKSAVKNKEGTTLRMSSKMFSANNLPQELLLTIRQTTKIRNTIENNMATDIKLSKGQISKIIQSGGFLGKLLGPLLKTGFPLLKSVIKPLGLLGLAAASSAIDAGVQEKKKKRKKKRKKKTWFWSSFRLCFANNSSNNLK